MYVADPIPLSPSQTLSAYASPAEIEQATQALARFWRNARVHTLHDPIDYKLRDLGRHALTGEFPVPSSYA